MSNHGSSTAGQDRSLR